MVVGGDNNFQNLFDYFYYFALKLTFIQSLVETAASNQPTTLKDPERKPILSNGGEKLSGAIFDNRKIVSFSCYPSISIMIITKKLTI